MLVPKAFMNPHQGAGTMLGGIWALPAKVSGPPWKTRSSAQASVADTEIPGEVCVDQGHQRGSARKGRLHRVPDYMFAAYLCIKNILPQVLHSALNCKLDHLIVSLV